MSNIIKKWFEESKQESLLFNSKGIFFTIYKGFKLSLYDGGLYKIEDARYSNFYKSPSKSCIDLFNKYGFVKGADLISFERNTKRVKSYLNRTEALYDKRKKFKKELPKDRRLNLKRIRNINKKIDEHLDQIFLFKTRIQQFNIKYNENTTTIVKGL